MGKGADRNKPCWCGSGKKYKQCHLDRSGMPAPTKQEALTKLREKFDKKYCLHPDVGACNGDIVKAHTIQRNGGLSLIARENHVCHLTVDYGSSAELLVPKVIGLKKASTFSGFCGFHDNKTFEPIEKSPFGFNEEHTFLLGYRAICRELFCKKAQVDSVAFLRDFDKGHDVLFQVLHQEGMTAIGTGATAGLRDAEYHKAIYDNIVLAGDFSNVRFYAIKFDSVPDVMCSSAKFVSHDFDGNLLQDLSKLDETLDQITFSIIATDTGGAAVFSWIGDSEPAERLITSLRKIPDNEVPSGLMRFAFEFFENLYFSPAWWDGLPDDEKHALQKRNTSAANMMEAREDYCLVDNGYRPVDWNVIERESNLSI